MFLILVSSRLQIQFQIMSFSKFGTVNTSFVDVPVLNVQKQMHDTWSQVLFAFFCVVTVCEDNPCHQPHSKPTVKTPPYYGCYMSIISTYQNDKLLVPAIHIATR